MHVTINKTPTEICVSSIGELGPPSPRAQNSRADEVAFDIDLAQTRHIPKLRRELCPDRLDRNEPPVNHDDLLQAVEERRASGVDYACVDELEALGPRRYPRLQRQLREAVRTGTVSGEAREGAVTLTVPGGSWRVLGSRAEGRK